MAHVQSQIQLAIFFTYISTMIFKSIYTLIVLLHFTFLPRFLFSQELHGHPSILVNELIGIKNLQEFGQYMFAESDFEYVCGETEYGKLVFAYEYNDGDRKSSTVKAYESDGSFSISIHTCNKLFYDFPNLSNRTSFMRRSTLYRRPSLTSLSISFELLISLGSALYSFSKGKMARTSMRNHDFI